MKNPIIFILMIALNFGCAGLQGPSNVFNIKGKDERIVKHTLDSKKMTALGKNWRPYLPAKFKTHLKQNNVEYVMNYLALENSIHSSCNKVILVSANDFSGDSDDLHSISGIFDEVWRFDACGKKLKYRIVNIKNTTSFKFIKVLD